MQAVILAGGLGTRIRPLLKGSNKPMLPVAEKPFLEHLLIQLRTFQITEVVLCIGYRGHIIENYFGSGQRWGMRLRYSREEALLGTAGAIKRAIPLIGGEQFLVMNGDSYFNGDISMMIEQHAQTDALATLALSWRENSRRYGSVELDDGGRIRRFNEKRADSGAGLINCGVYLFHREIFASIPEDQPVSLERELFPSLVGKRFYGCPLDGYFVDIGIPTAYRDVLADPSGILTFAHIN